MWTVGEVVLLSLGFGAIVLLALRLFLSFWYARGTRILTCPENQQTVSVEVDSWAALKDSLAGPLSWKLCDCSRWPEKAGCEQKCISQIEAAPRDCRLRHILTSWYLNKQCAGCGKVFQEVHWHDHQPALLDSKGFHREWSDFSPETIPEVLKKHQPLCWDCLVARDFRLRFPELVTDRDFAARDTPGIWRN